MSSPTPCFGRKILMSLFTKEYVERTFKRMTWWDKHPDTCPNDYGPPQSLYYQDKVPMTREQENEYLDLLLSAEEQGYQITY